MSIIELDLVNEVGIEVGLVSPPDNSKSSKRNPNSLYMTLKLPWEIWSVPWEVDPGAEPNICRPYAEHGKI